jgi:hypothetical protein
LRWDFFHDELESIGGFRVVNLARTYIAVQACDAPAVVNSDRLLVSGEREASRKDATEDNEQ